MKIEPVLNMFKCFLMSKIVNSQKIPIVKNYWKWLENIKSFEIFPKFYRSFQKWNVIFVNQPELIVQVDDRKKTEKMLYKIGY
jgi:hypothetical protein